jgi:hypothetical protein
MTDQGFNLGNLFLSLLVAEPCTVCNQPVILQVSGGVRGRFMFKFLLESCTAPNQEQNGNQRAPTRVVLEYPDENLPSSRCDFHLWLHSGTR